ncbi:ribosomal protein S6 kinase alpha-4-like [Bacillus rossius redtenbacheri]|uniref:ribosomal protein S6 kinase alpha-4-like n=1 Tax=Bacillus rossius redtenbacheri TaxID=93214 RepID=UPI002FDCF6E2
MSRGVRVPVAAGSEESFEVLKVLGRGAFSTVHLVRNVGGCSYALKELQKGQYRTKVPPEGAASAGGFLLHLHYAFQTEEAALFVVDHAAGSDLTAVLEDLGFLVLAQLLTALHTLHSLGVMHRDVKADHVVLADYGLCSEPAGEGCLARRTFCGTLLTGIQPFDPKHEGDRRKTVSNIINKEPQYPPRLSPEAADLLRRLLSLGGPAADLAKRSERCQYTPPRIPVRLRLHVASPPAALGQTTAPVQSPAPSKSTTHVQSTAQVQSTAPV